MQARSKKQRRSTRTVHLRLFTNRGEDEDPNQTDDRPTSCGLFKTPHYLSGGDAGGTKPDCHINVFTLSGDTWTTMQNRIDGMDRKAKTSICKTCRKRAELMISLGGFG